MKVKRKTLFLIACLVWGLAGVNILRIGVAAYHPTNPLQIICYPFLFFFVFQKYIFGKLVRKHTDKFILIRMKGYFF